MTCKLDEIEYDITCLIPLLDDGVLDAAFDKWKDSQISKEEYMADEYYERYLERVYNANQY